VQLYPLLQPNFLRIKIYITILKKMNLSLFKIGDKVDLDHLYDNTISKINGTLKTDF